jgi:YMGG-like Gly-zipper
MKPIALIAIAAVWLAAAPALAQQYYYPTKGQSPDQQSRDQQECSGWAMQQSGYNPAQAGAPPPSGGMVRGAAGGAALGAVGGAIGGDAGQGAAIGAATGALFGGVRQHRQRRQ